MMKHIILMSLDTLRYDCIGYQPDKRELLKHDVLKYLETSTLDDISEKSLCFTQCISTNTYTTAAHASVLTGLYPPKHGVRGFYQSKLHKDVYTLAEILKIFGYKTVIATDTPVNFLPLNMNKGFDHVYDKDDHNVFKFIEEHKDEKIFLFAHFFDIHDPYLMTMSHEFDNKDYFSTIKALYKQYHIQFPSNTKDGWYIWNNLRSHIGRRKDILFPLYVKGVSKFDKNRLRAFLDRIKNLNLLNDGLLIIFSDHGEGKKINYNPEEFWHGGGVFDNVIRVPLIVHHRELSHKILDKTVSLVDIFPTIIEIAIRKNVKDLLPYSIHGKRTLLDSEEREGAYCETSQSRNMLKPLGVQLPFLQNCSQMSSFLLQRAIRTKGKKFILYGEPESLSENTIDSMDNREFLKAMYRKRMCKFERYDEYMRNLYMLNTGELTKKELYQRHMTERFELYDLEKDPYEENPITEWKDPDVLSSYKARILELSTPSVQSEDIFPPLNRVVLERIAKCLFLDEREESLQVVTGNKNLFNELIEEFLSRNKALPDEEFLEKCYRVFLDRKPEGDHFEQLVGLLRDGVARETVFMTKIFQQVEFRAAEVPENVARQPYPEQKEKMQKEISRREHTIGELQNQLEEKDILLRQIYSSKTWKLGKIYGKLFGVEAKWRKNFPYLF